MATMETSGPEFMAFQEAVPTFFGPLAKDCGAKLVEIEPWLYGFATPYAQLTIGGYPGHSPSLCVKIRPCAGDWDWRDIGLPIVELFVTGKISPFFRNTTWKADPLRQEIELLAAKTREVALPFLTLPNADWAGLNALVDKRIKGTA